MSKLSTRVRRLHGAASVLAVAVAGFGVAMAGSAQAQTCTGAAQTITSTGAGPYTGPTYAIDNGTAPNCASSTTITTGTTAVLVPSWAYLGTVEANGWVPLINYSSALQGAGGGSPQGGDIVGPLIVQQGATLVVGGQQSIYGAPYEPTYNVLNAAGNVVVEGNGGYNGGNQFALIGTSTITGNLTLEAGANFRVGEYYNQTAGAAMGSYSAQGEYAASAITFGPNTNVALQGSSGSGNDTLMFLNLSAPAVIGGYLSATQNSEVWLHAGSLTVNGADTTANPFVGTLQLDSGTTLIVGDSTHPGAILGDPNNTNGSTFTLNITGSAGNIVTLQGYGTIYGTVNNAGGVVTPGGTAGTFGTLTVSQYNQSSTGVLQVEVSPTGADRLNVLGTASLGGTLQIKIDSGNYGNEIIPIITAGSITGKFASVETIGTAAAGLAITPTSYDVVIEQSSAVQVFGHLISADRSNIALFNDAVYDVQTTSAHGAPRITYSNGFEAWAEPFGQVDNVYHSGYGYHADEGGLMAGFERRFSDLNAVAGVALSYGGGSLNTDAGKTNASTTTYDAALYGGFDMPNARIEAQAFYNSYNASVVRNLGASGSVDSSPSGKSYGASLQVSNPINTVLTPYVRFTFADISQPAVTEQGTNLLALKVDGIEKGYFNGEFGFKVHPNFGQVVHPEITLAVQHDFTQNPGDSVVGEFSNLPSSPFTFNWKGDQQTAGIVGVMLSSDITSRFQVYGKLNGRITTDGQVGELRLGASYHF